MTVSIPLYPLLLQPVLHTRVWGGRRLATVFGKKLPTAAPYGESWEMHDTATVANGPLAGRTLGDLLAEYGYDLIGAHNNPADGFPLLVKLMDIADWVSVQVHPDDQHARRLEDEPRGKTEAWYFLAAEPGAELVIGVSPGTTREAMVEAIRNNTLEKLLVYADVRAGDMLFIPPGTIHAIGPGLLIYEVQQSSDLTYRLYDWGRMGLDGKPRTLHIDKGVEMSNIAYLPEIAHPEGREVVRCEYFTTTMEQPGEWSRYDTFGRFFHALTCIEGSATVTARADSVTMQTGQTALIPACLGEYTLSGDGRVLNSFQTG